jgi:hypothetical protein
VQVSEKKKRINDNGGARSGTDRRQNIVKACTPERRSGGERRSGNDRRRSQGFRGEKAIERRELFR